MERNKRTSALIFAIPLILFGLAVMFLKESALNTVCIILGVLITLIGIFFILNGIKTRTKPLVKFIGMAVFILLTATGVMLIILKSGFIRFAIPILLLYGAGGFALLSTESHGGGNVKALRIILAVLLAALAIFILIDPAFTKDIARYIQGGAFIYFGLTLIFFMPVADY